MAEGQREPGLSLVSAVEAFEEVMDSLCVPQYNRDGEERVVLFLKMAAGHPFRPELVKRIQGAIRVGLSARHVPSLILETKDIPVRPPGSRARSAAVLPRAHSLGASRVGSWLLLCVWFVPLLGDATLFLPSLFCRFLNCIIQELLLSTGVQRVAGPAARPPAHAALACSQKH